MKKSEVSSAASTTYTVAWAAKEVGVPRPTVDSWISRGVIQVTGQIDGRPAFSQTDLDALRKVTEQRKAALDVLNMRPFENSSSRK